MRKHPCFAGQISSPPRAAGTGLFPTVTGCGGHPPHWLPADPLLGWEDAAEGEEEVPSVAALSGGSPDPQHCSALRAL